MKHNDFFVYYESNFSFNVCTTNPVYNDHLMGYFSAFWSSSDEPRKAEIVSKSKLVHSVFIKTLYWINHRWYFLFYIIAGHAIVVAKDITLLFYHGNADILTLW